MKTKIGIVVIALGLFGAPFSFATSTHMPYVECMRSGIRAKDPKAGDVDNRFAEHPEVMRACAKRHPWAYRQRVRDEARTEKHLECHEPEDRVDSKGRFCPRMEYNPDTDPARARLKACQDRAKGNRKKLDACLVNPHG